VHWIREYIRSCTAVYPAHFIRYSEDIEAFIHAVNVHTMCTLNNVNNVGSTV